MATNFHYNDVPPQNWLDQLHSFKIPRLFDIQMEDTQRRNLTQRAKNQLKIWREGLRDQIKAIEQRYSDKENVKLQMLAPYRVIDTLGKDLDEQVSDLEQRLKSGRPIPAQFEFGTTIFGDMKTKRWHLGSREDEKRWKDFLATERRYMSMSEEYKVQSQGMKNAVARVKEVQADLKGMIAKYNRQKGWLYLVLKLSVALLITFLGIVVGSVAFIANDPIVSSIDNLTFGGIMLIVGVVAAITSVVLARNHRRMLITLRNDIVRMRATLKDLKDEVIRQKQLFYPTQQTFKEVREDYQVLKASF